MRRPARNATGFFVLALAALVAPAWAWAQESASAKPTAPRAAMKSVVKPAVVPVKSPPLRDIPPINQGIGDQKTVRNSEFPFAGRFPPSAPTRQDPSLQRAFGITAPDPTGVNFDGAGANGFAPPDSDGKVGPNNYIQWINTRFSIFDKTGTLLYGPAQGNTLFTSLGGTCASHNDGDPIVEYDLLADRWVISQFAVGAGDGFFSHQCVAVSVTGDPLGSWFLYDFPTSVANFVDYPHWGVWPDSYYMSAHIFNGVTLAFISQGMFTFERPKMLAGLPARFQFVDMTGNFFGALPSDLDSLTPPPPGAPNTIVAFGSPEFDGSPTDVLHVWQGTTTWGATPTMTVTGPTDVATDPFNSDLCGFSRNCVPQLGTTTTVDAISGRMLWRLAYRNFGDHESLVVNHTVNVSAASGHATNQAGIRWYEIQSPSTTPTIAQQGTYAPDTTWRWMGSIAMDNSGDMALGYSRSDATLFPEIDITGRLSSDPAGTMGSETLMKAGLGNQNGGLNRWGDYSAMTVDPRDGCTFWYTNQYQPASGSFNWSTRIASFRFPSCVSPARGTIQGTVTDASTGLPLAGALVEVDNGFSGMTDSNGKYTIVLPPGAYNVQATAEQRNCTPSTSQPANVGNGGVVTLNFALGGTPEMILGNITVDDSIGNNNGVINLNECVLIDIPLLNVGCATETGITGTLTTTTPDVTIVHGTAAYPNVNASGTSLSATPFEIATGPTFVCGTNIALTLTLASAQGPTVFNFSVPTCQGPDVLVSGALVNGTDLQQPNGRLGRNGAVGSCDGPKACPGPLGAGPRLYRTHSFANTSAFPRCLTVTLDSHCGAVLIGGAYLNSYDPNNFCTNYLDDLGNSFSVPASMSTVIPAGDTLVVVVSEANAGLVGCSGYDVTVSGLLDLTTDGGRPAAPTAGSNSPICAGGTLTLTASSITNATYLWSGPNGFTSTLQNPSITGATTAASGTYSVTATVGGCTTDPATTNVTVNAGPDATITAPSAVCSSTSGNTASVPDAGLGAAYVWTISNGTITGGQGTASITFTASATSPIGLGVTVTNAAGCPATGSASVTVNTTCGNFFTLTPCRLIDTRTTQVPSLTAGGSRTFILTGGTCGVPSSAQAVSVNIAATNEVSGGNLQIFAGGSAVPTTATINYNTGQTRSNNAVIKLGPGGTITVKCNQGTGTTDLVLDVNGYFE